MAFVVPRRREGGEMIAKDTAAPRKNFGYLAISLLLARCFNGVDQLAKQQS